MSDLDTRRKCPIRLFIPAQETNTSVVTWTDVGFAYVRELSGTVLAPLIRVIPGDMSLVDLRGARPGRPGFDEGIDADGNLAASRWHPYAHMFHGICPRPSELGAERPSFVNVVIGAGDLTENLWTLGALNVLITGYGIPPYKVGWLPARAWKYDYVIAPSHKHADRLSALCAEVRVHTIPPRENVSLLVDILDSELSGCIPEAERIYE